MNEELQKALSELVQKSINGIDTTTSFIEAELPDYIYQLLMWHSISQLIYFVFGLSLLLSAAAVLRWLVPAQQRWIDSGREYGDRGLSYILTGVILIFLLALGSCYLNIEWLKIWIAPKVWLIEYAAGLIK